ncbi:MAG: phosphoribosyltransferase family protein [Ferruginibacter sp.]
MKFLKQIFADTFHLFFPHTCPGCGSDLLNKTNLLCIRCITKLPHTHFAFFENNPIEKIFSGRVPVRAAHSEFYFEKNELIQHLIHRVKYGNDIDTGVYLGEITGKALLKSGRFSTVDYIIPLPLNKSKQKKRGYNQSEIICRGIHTAMNIPLMINNIIKVRKTESQTRKHRGERWNNVAGSFVVTNPNILEGKHILLVDDVITTGATIEACALAILQVRDCSLSIASLSHASK